MHSYTHPFLYDNLLERLASGSAGQSRWYLYGGRGLGKTTLLRRLQQRLVTSRRAGFAPPPDQTPEVTWVDARTPRPRDVIVAWCKSPQGMLIADEFDAYLDLAIDDAIRELVDHRDRGARIVVATRKRPQELERWALAARRMMPPTSALRKDESPCFATFHRERLNPWAGDHLAALRSAHHAAFAGLRRTLSWLVDESNGRHERLPGEDAIRPWVEVVAAVTGGHPALVDASFDLLLIHWFGWLIGKGELDRADLEGHHLDRYAAHGQRTGHALMASLFESPKDAGAPELERLGVVLEDYLMNEAMPSLERAMWRLREDHPAVFVKMQFVADKPGESRVKDPTERQVMLLSGLAYKDDEGQLRVPSGLIASTLSTMDPPTMEGSEASSRGVAVPTGPVRVLGMTVEGAEGVEHGTLVVRTTAGPHRIELRGRPWEVLWFLHQHREQVHTVAQMREAIGFPEEGSVRHAIAKLREAVRGAGFDGVPENVPKKGYRFGGIL